MHTCATLIWNVPHSNVHTDAQNPRNCRISIDMMRMSLQYGCFIFILMNKHHINIHLKCLYATWRSRRRTTAFQMESYASKGLGTKNRKVTTEVVKMEECRIAGTEKGGLLADQCG